MGSIYSGSYRRFIERLRKARIEARLTQVQAAKALDRPQSYVSNCERGEKMVDVEELRLFARLYKKPVGYFLDD